MFLLIADAITQANAEAQRASTFLYFTIPLVASIIGGLLSNGFAYLLLLANQKHALRMVSIEKRFEVYQEAYSLWDKLVAVIHDHDQKGIPVRCYDWWSDHCLYLAEPLRSEFRMRIFDVSRYNDLKGDSDDKRLEAAWERIHNVYNFIEDGLGLPHMDRKKETDKA